MNEEQLLIDKLNIILKKNGILEIGMVNVDDCIGQIKNARYFTPEKFRTLVQNIKNDGMESMPLVIKSKTKQDKYEIISGHHRIQAAKQANIEKILVFITPELSKDEIISKQLSHNALVGVDDKTILAELFQSITSLEGKLSTGLNDEIKAISYETLNCFKVGQFKEFTILFLPEDEELTDQAMEKIAEDINIKSDTTIRLTNIKYWDRFAKAIRKIKKIENIKSNGTAFIRMIELAENNINKNEK